jgi:hypothetical protein
VRAGLHFLVQETHADVHADLIAGLPGETPDSFAKGFDQLYDWQPDEIQVGILKVLPGTPIHTHAAKWGMRFLPTAPYTITETNTMSNAFIQQIERFAGHWERVVNRNHLPRIMHALLASADSPWSCFNAFSTMLHERYGAHGIDLLNICRLLLAFSEQHTNLPRSDVTSLMRADYHCNGKRITTPAFMR